MKILLTIATKFVALTSVSAASAGASSMSHHAWQNPMQTGHNKSNLPMRVRVWVQHKVAVADCHFAMFKGQVAPMACMDMQGQGTSHSKG